MGETARTEAAYPPQSDTGRAGPGVLQRAWWLALGILITVGEQTTRVAETLVEKGRGAEPKVKRAASELPGLAGEVTAGIKRAATKLAGSARRREGGTSAPWAEEFQKLAEEVRQLRTRLTEKEGTGQSQGQDPGTGH